MGRKYGGHAAQGALATQYSPQPPCALHITMYSSCFQSEIGASGQKGATRSLYTYSAEETGMLMAAHCCSTRQHSCGEGAQAYFPCVR